MVTSIRRIDIGADSQHCRLPCPSRLSSLHLTFCDIDCAGGYANFDEAKGCANAGKGYCCKDTKPAKYPFMPNTK